MFQEKSGNPDAQAFFPFMLSLLWRVHSKRLKKELLI
jgi:hypothetical protein